MRRRPERLVRIIIFFVGIGLIPALALGQSAAEDSLREAPSEVPAPLSVLAPLFFPKVIQDLYQLREYIREGEFAADRGKHGDRSAVDVLYDRAVRLSWNNRYEALFILMLATMDHERFGVRIPLLGPLIWVPLTSEWEDEFTARVRALPKKLFPDSPPGPAGDRDKLQHFFGSAFLTYLLDSRAAADRVGTFVEWGEDLFIVGGVYDTRDIEANRRGQYFGLMLYSEPGLRPSRFFQTPLSRPMVIDSVDVQSEE